MKLTAEQARKISYTAELTRVYNTIHEVAREEKYVAVIIIHSPSIIYELLQHGYFIEDLNQDSKYLVKWKEDESNSCGE